MNSDIQYIVDDSGKKKSVLVPIRVWEELNNNYQKLQKKLEIFDEIKNGLREVKDAKHTGKKLQTLKDFLSEGHS